MMSEKVVIYSRKKDPSDRSRTINQQQWGWRLLHRCCPNWFFYCKRNNSRTKKPRNNRIPALLITWQLSATWLDYHSRNQRFQCWLQTRYWGTSKRSLVLSIQMPAYNNEPIKVEGSCILNVIHKFVKYPTLFIVADTKSTPIIGLQTCSRLNLIKRINEMNVSSSFL